MIFNKELGVFHLTKQQPDEMKIIIIYRFVSLLSISIFFITGTAKLTLITKAFVTLSVGLSAALLSYLYQRNLDSPGNIKTLIIIETIGNSLFLIPTGGLVSPFVWYSINTILISAMLLEGLYSWISLFVYLFTSTILGYMIFENMGQNFVEYIGSESNLILSLMLMTAIIRQLAMYIKRLRAEGIKQTDMNMQLSLANDKVRESINLIMELYQAVYMFTTLNDKEDMIGTMIEYTKKVTKADKVFFYNFADEHNRISAKANNLVDDIYKSIEPRIMELRDMILESSAPVEIDIEGIRYLLMSIRSNCITYGVLGIAIGWDQENSHYLEYMDQLKFMSDLGSIVFERLEMEQVNERLVIAEEQNRIANEIHDNVQQRLFSTSFGIYGIIRNIENLTANEVKEDLNLIRNSIDSAMKELRSAIYSMSWSKGGTDNFKVDIIKFFEEIKKLNNVKINFNVMGDTEQLSLVHKKSLYRIICEGVGNAVRHGNAAHIEVNLNIQSNITVLKISDDGTGFDLKLLRQSRRMGLGIKNIEALAQYMKGKALISSSPGRGTRIKVTFPMFTHLHREEKIV